MRLAALLPTGLLIALSAANPAALAAESAAVTSANDSATLVTDRDAAGPDQSLRVGLRLRLKPGWHTYWINPGDAGEAPTLTVTAEGRTGANRTGTSGALHWPVPVRISEGGLMSYAYTGDVLLPADLALHGSGPVTLRAHAEWLVCAQVCIPESGDFTLALPASDAPAPPGRDAPLFAAADARMPVDSPFAAHFSADRLVLEGKGIARATVANAWFMPLESGVIDQVAPQKPDVTDGKLSLSLKFLKSHDAPLKGVIVLQDANGQQSALNVSASFSAPPVQAPEGTSRARALAFAFLGGLILNLMPCVFPVLAMKALSLARIGGRERAHQLHSALFYTIGVVGALAVLGGVMIGLRAAGSAAGWGFQFQSPGFVVAVCWLLFLMALNLLGVFEISAGRLGRLHPAGAGHVEDLTTGLLAVIVATPCTAPFMGVAIAAGLGGPPLMGLLVFVFMGLGLAAPYALVAGVPGAARLMPRPGAWMVVLRQALAFPLLASCVWLLWVAVIQRGADFVVVAAGGMVLLGCAAWLFGIGQRRAMREGGRGAVLFCRAASLACLAIAAAALAHGVSTSPVAVARAADAGSEPFSEGKLADLRAQGRPVFVDMTAAWCITCMVNERVALDTTSVRAAFAARHVVYLKGDWTNRDPAISAYLKAHGRDGVPLYVYYSSKGEEQVLPQVLTPGAVIRAVSG